MSDTDENETMAIQRYCEYCGEETEWSRKQTAFGDGYRCSCARRFIELSEVRL